MRYRLRTLLIVLTLGPPVLAIPVIAHRKAAEMRRANELKQLELAKLMGTQVRGPYYIKSKPDTEP